MPTPSAREATLENTYAAKLGDRDALADLFEKHGDKLRRYLCARTDDECLADEAAQEAWLKVARTIGTFDPTKASFQFWLFAIGRNTLRDMHRSAYRKRETLTADMLDHDHVGGDSAEGSTARRQASARIAAELRSLPDNQRTTLIHRMWTGLSIAETADLMGATQSSVKVWQHRACEALKKRLKGEFDLLDAFLPDTSTTSAYHEATSREAAR